MRIPGTTGGFRLPFGIKLFMAWPRRFRWRWPGIYCMSRPEYRYGFFEVYWCGGCIGIWWPVGKRRA